jgi:hypothetical protein
MNTFDIARRVRGTAEASGLPTHVRDELNEIADQISPPGGVVVWWKFFALQEHQDWKIGIIEDAVGRPPVGIIDTEGGLHGFSATVWRRATVAPIEEKEIV